MSWTPKTAKIKMTDDPSKLQAEMDSLNEKFVKLSATSITQHYAFVPASPSAISYLTANFLHGGWMHLIGNMWFLWLAGFVLEDVWGRWLYSVFYLVAGVAALQFYAWTNPGSITPTLGASGAVAALMGAFLVRYPKMKIGMGWIIYFSILRLDQDRKSLPHAGSSRRPPIGCCPCGLPLKFFTVPSSDPSSGVAHWAHVGGFLFGAAAALAIQHSGLEQKANKKIEEELTWNNDPELEQAGNMMEHGQLDEALSLLLNHRCDEAELRRCLEPDPSDLHRGKAIPRPTSTPPSKPAACT